MPAIGDQVLYKVDDDKVLPATVVAVAPDTTATLHVLKAHPLDVPDETPGLLAQSAGSSTIEGVIEDTNEPQAPGTFAPVVIQ